MFSFLSTLFSCLADLRFARATRDTFIRLSNRNRTNMKFQAIAIAFIVIINLPFWLYDSPFAYVTREKDIKIDAEYINGILTASSILFGIWVLVLGIKPFESQVYDKKTREFLRKTVVRESFFFCLFFLGANVLFVFLASLSLLSQLFTITFTGLSFLLNVAFLTLTLDFYIFK
jgi:hypothetical protein